MEERYPFALPSLPCAYDALAPELDSRTLMLHHDEHMAGLIHALNRLLEPYPAYQSWPLARLCLRWAELPGEIRQKVRESAGGVYGHDLYFANLHPTPCSAPLPPLDGAVARNFGDLPALKSAMKNAALAQQGSGWVWLTAAPDGELAVNRTAGQDTPLPLFPLLSCDVWEHAYYLPYQNRRGDYFDGWWRLVNWPRVSRAYELFLSGRPRRPTP